VEKSLRVAKAFFDQNAGKATSMADAAKFTTGGKATGPLTVEVSSGKKYGFLRTEGGKLAPEDRARKVALPPVRHGPDHCIAGGGARSARPW